MTRKYTLSKKALEQRRKVSYFRKQVLERDYYPVKIKVGSGVGGGEGTSQEVNIYVPKYYKARALVKKIWDTNLTKGDYDELINSYVEHCHTENMEFKEYIKTRYFFLDVEAF